MQFRPNQKSPRGALHPRNKRLATKRRHHFHRCSEMSQSWIGLLLEQREKERGEGGGGEEEEWDDSGAQIYTAVLILACHLVVTRAGSSKDKLEASWWSFTPGMLTKWQTLLDDEIQLVLITRTTLYTFTPWIQMNTQATAYVWGTEQVYFWKSKTKSCRC